MPLYNFVCPICGTQFEERLSFHQDTHEVVCPQGHSGVRRVFSAPTIVFKGSGFYVNDSRKKPARESGSDS